MFRITLTCLLILVATIAHAGYPLGVMVDSKGKPTPNGRPLAQWFSGRIFFGYPFAEQATRDDILFEQHNRPLIEWEIEKQFKRKIFKLSFFKRYLVTTNYCVFYLARNPKKIAGFYHLLYYYSQVDDYQLSEHRTIVLYLLARSGQNIEKLNRMPDYFMWQQDQAELTKRYNSMFMVNKKFNPTTARQQNDNKQAPKAIPILPKTLTTALNDDDDDAVIKACKFAAASSLYGKIATPKLQQIIKSKRGFTVKIAAICAVAEIGDKTSIPLLKQLLKSKNRLLARAAKQAIYLLQPVDKNDKYFKQMLR